MSELPIDAQLRLADIRLRVLNRQPVSQDEHRQLIRDLRQSRDSAARASAAARRTASKSIGSNKTTTKAPSLDLNTLFPGMSAKGDDNGTEESTSTD